MRSERLSIPVTREDWILGNGDSASHRTAELTVVLYGDFECPYSGEAFVTLKHMKHRLGSKLRVVFRHLPLPELHPDSFCAAVAAEAAGRQRRFFEMTDLLFHNATYLSREDLLQYASHLKLDEARFRADLDSEEVALAVRKDVNGAEKTGLWQTPALFIDEEKFDDPWSPTALKKAIQRSLDRVETVAAKKTA